MNEYKVIKIKYNKETQSAHHIFYKKYKPNRSDDLNNLVSSNVYETNSDRAAKTLFVTGLPSYMNVQAVKNVFNIFGQIEEVLLFREAQTLPFSALRQSKKVSYFSNDQSGLGFKVGYVVFGQATSVEKALNKPSDEERSVSTKQNPISIGMKKWCEDYKNKFIDEKKMKREIDAFMQSYDQKQSKLEEEEVDKTNVPDDDGWITVTSKSRKANRALTERNILKLKSKQKKRTEKMKLLNFYNFQAKESKRDYIVQLRKKFEEDKKHIEEMKQNRKFKPF